MLSAGRKRTNDSEESFSKALRQRNSVWRASQELQIPVSVEVTFCNEFFLVVVSRGRAGAYSVGLSCDFTKGVTVGR
jgi:hypothetical protein